MAKSFLSVDFKTIVKVVLWVYVLENLVLYVLSLGLMINSTSKLPKLDHEELEESRTSLEDQIRTSKIHWPDQT